MSLLNLNTSTGRGPRGKKSLKMFMGAGLLVAVLGIGSTLAANITINSPGGQTEFGQGITQTVFCGEDRTVTVSPISSYSNSSSTVKIKVVNSDGSEVTPSSPPSTQTIFTKDSTSFPKWLSRSTTISGWWLSSANSSTVISSSYPSPIVTALGLANGSSSYYFAPESSSGKFRRGNSSSSWTEYSVQVSDDSNKFKLSGVNITNIAPECKGVNFVVSGYPESANSPLTLATGVDIVAATWCNTSGDVPSGRLSKSRTAYSSISSGVSAKETSTSLQLTFSGSDTQSSRNVSKILVETQEDVLGTACSS